MAMVIPSSIFGVTTPFQQPVHVLFLIENSKTMLDHWQYLRQYMLPSILGAIRLANPGAQVEVYWKTTGITTPDRSTSSKDRRQFDDFPDIDIIDHPANKLTPFFVRQSIDLFVSGSNQAQPVTRHLFIITVSNIGDDSLILRNSTDRQNPDKQWELIGTKVATAGIILHVINNPMANLSQIVDLYRRTIRLQDRTEFIPGVAMDPFQCVCYLSGFPQADEQSPSGESSHTNIVYFQPVNDTASMERSGPRQRTRSRVLPSTRIANSSASTGSGALQGPDADPHTPSLVSRLQAIHNLTKRKSRAAPLPRPSFLRPISPVAGSSPTATGVTTSNATARRAPPSPPATSTQLQLRYDSSLEQRKRRMASVNGPIITRPSFPSQRARDHVNANATATVNSATINSAGFFQLPSPDSDTSSPSSPNSLWTQETICSSSSTSPLNNPDTFDSYGNTGLAQQFAQPTLPVSNSPTALFEHSPPAFMSAAAHTPLPPVAPPLEPLLINTGNHIGPHGQYMQTGPYSPDNAYMMHQAPALCTSTELGQGTGNFGSSLSAGVSPVDGHAPFLMDSEYEARCALRMRQVMHRQQSQSQLNLQSQSQPQSFGSTGFLLPQTGMLPSPADTSFAGESPTHSQSYNAFPDDYFGLQVGIDGERGVQVPHYQVPGGVLPPGY